MRGSTSTATVRPLTLSSTRTPPSRCLVAGIDDGVAPLTLPFAFQFYGTSYPIVCASANGALYFVADAPACGGFSYFANVDLATTAPPNDAPAIMPFWSDLTFQTAGAGIGKRRGARQTPPRK